MNEIYDLDDCPFCNHPLEHDYYGSFRYKDCEQRSCGSTFELALKNNQIYRIKYYLQNICRPALIFIENDKLRLYTDFPNIENSIFIEDPFNFNRVKEILQLIEFYA